VEEAGSLLQDNVLPFPVDSLVLKVDGEMGNSEREE
jgi:hypothetical protein